MKEHVSENSQFADINLNPNKAGVSPAELRYSKLGVNSMTNNE